MQLLLQKRGGGLLEKRTNDEGMKNVPISQGEY